MSQDLLSALGADGVEALRRALGVEGPKQGVGVAKEKRREVVPVVPVDSGQTLGVGGVKRSSGITSSDSADGVDEVIGAPGSSVSSWSDMVEEDQSVSGVPVVSEAVRSAVKFGGFGASVPDEVLVTPAGLMSSFVRSDASVALRKELEAIGIKMPKNARYMLAMCTHSAATMPDFFRQGKDKLQTLAVLGDAVLCAALSSDMLGRGEFCASMQQLRVTRLTDAHLSRVFAKSRFAKCVSVASGVSLAYHKTGATALEAIAGLIAYYRSPVDVRVYVAALQLFD